MAAVRQTLHDGQADLFPPAPLPPGRQHHYRAVGQQLVHLRAVERAEGGDRLVCLGRRGLDGSSAMLLLWPLRDRVMSLVLAAALAALAVGWMSSYL